MKKLTQTIADLLTVIGIILLLPLWVLLWVVMALKGWWK